MSVVRLQAPFGLPTCVVLLWSAATLVPLAAEERPPSQDARARSWDAAYSESDPAFTTGPNAFLVESSKGLTPGEALDVGMGQGRNAVFLATQGWKVTGFDLSPVGVSRSQENARKAGVTLTALVKSAEEFEWGKDRWDLVVLTYFPMLRRMLPQIIGSVKPGGFVVVEAFHQDAGLDRPPGPGDGVTFSSNELLTLFAPLRVVDYRDLRAMADWGRYDTRLVRLLAQKRP